MYYVAYSESLELEGYYLESQKEIIPTNYVGISDSLYDELFSWNGQSGSIFLKQRPNGDEILEDILLFENKEVPVVTMIEDPMPTQDEIDFALYVLATEDRLAAIESMMQGGV